MRSISVLPFLFVFLMATACGDDSDGTAADRAGVGAQCSAAAACASYDFKDGGTAPLTCLTQFAGGYCGLQGCVASVDCPAGSICVNHTDGANYCFRACVDKAECNRNRAPESEANCSASFDWATVSDDNGSKACIPPSSGI